MKRYACKDGDYGLAVSEQICVVPVRRVDGKWFVVNRLRGQFVNGYELQPLRGETIEVYRLTGWGADGPTEMWVEPVALAVGMRVFRYTSNGEIDHGDFANDGVLIAVREAIEFGSFFRGEKIHTVTNDHLQEALDDPVLAASLANYRCADTGAPLVLPKETA